MIAVTAALATFGHMPKVRASNGQLATLAQIVLALPDGTLPEICETYSDGTPKHTAGTQAHCDFCTLIEPPPAPVASGPRCPLSKARFALRLSWKPPAARSLSCDRPAGRRPRTADAAPGLT